MQWLLNKPEEKEEAEKIKALLAETVTMRDKVVFYYGRQELCGKYLSEQLKKEYILAADLQQSFEALLESI